MKDGRRVALITGAAGTAGRAVVAALAADGVRVALVGSGMGRLEALATELGLPSEQWSAHAADLRDSEAAVGAVAPVLGRFGRLDILVHLVGGWSGGLTVVQTPVAEVESMLDQHVRTTLHVVQASLPHMTEGGWGRIVAISSPVASVPQAKSVPYAIAKAGQEALLGTVAREVAGTGVTANVLHVKSIDAEAGDAPASPRAGWTAPAQIAATVRWLCSDEAAAVNGARIPLYGA